MTYEEILKEVEGLDKEHQCLLLVHIKTMLAKPTDNADLARKSAVYINTMNHLVGRDIREEKRDNILLWGRNIVIYQLIKDGFSESAVGKIFNKDHSTVNYAKNRVKEALELPAFFKTEIKLYTDFRLAICDNNNITL